MYVSEVIRQLLSKFKTLLTPHNQGRWCCWTPPQELVSARGRGSEGAGLQSDFLWGKREKYMNLILSSLGDDWGMKSWCHYCFWTVAISCLLVIMWLYSKKKKKCQYSSWPLSSNCVTAERRGGTCFVLRAANKNSRMEELSLFDFSRSKLASSEWLWFDLVTH